MANISLRDKLAQLEQTVKQQSYEIRDLKKQLKEAQQESDKANVENEQLKEQNRELVADYQREMERYENLLARQKKQYELQLADLKRNGSNTISSISSVQNDSSYNEIVLSAYRRGEMYYDNTINNIAHYNGVAKIEASTLLDASKTGKRPFFDTNDLIIRINPRTGNELPDTFIRLIKEAIKQDQFGASLTYDDLLEELDEQSCKSAGDDLVATAYDLGKELLQYYEYMFQSNEQ